MKWNRKALKRRSRSLLKTQYWAAVGVCFIMMMFFDRYAVSKQAIVSYNPAWETEEQVVEETLHSDSLRFMNNIADTIAHQLDMKRVEDPTYATEGVLSTLLAKVTDPSGPYIRLLHSLDAFIRHDVANGFLRLFSLALTLLVGVFVTNLIQVGERRFFLESTQTVETPIRRILFLFQEKRFWRPLSIMLLRSVKLFLWALTLVMYPFKYFEYAMIPYIVAENPDVTAKEAFQLSRQMMQGNRFRLFCLHLSFWYWDLLSMITFGFVGFFFVNPYRTATETEVYLALREQVLGQKTMYAERLIGIQAFLPEPEAEGRFAYSIDYDRNYRLHTYILLFFSFAMIGWLWEVAIHLFEDGVFVNRGVLFGPWLPIYGTGGVAIVFLLRKLGKSPLILFLASTTLCSVVEYFTSWMLEIVQGAKWWDYSGYLFNLNGRICLEGALVFGMGGCLFVYFLAPFLDDLYGKIQVRVQWKVCVVLVTLFLCDTIYSHFHPNMGEGITDYDSQLITEEVTWEEALVDKEISDVTWSC